MIRKCITLVRSYTVLMHFAVFNMLYRVAQKWDSPYL